MARVLKEYVRNVHHCVLKKERAIIVVKNITHAFVLYLNAEVATWEPVSSPHAVRSFWQPSAGRLDGERVDLWYPRYGKELKTATKSGIKAE